MRNVAEGSAERNNGGLEALPVARLGRTSQGGVGPELVSSHTLGYKRCSTLSALRHTCAALAKVRGIIWIKMFWQDYSNLREVVDLACKDERNQKMESFQKMVRASYTLNQLNAAYGD